ncbi:hypothetical protein KW850_31180 [Bacillus sp. sid0103]|uniref:DUF6944 family repetitive protein n=1 Tax=Bacillus sp. sid0103 TaxID=2856337 RepID=UPI001C485C62|nr:hypothetical protein [Bacillus sp. sid0103]MBV7509588.1 hypothetical protein [Bacillus sp. sid0103]
MKERLGKWILGVGSLIDANGQTQQSLSGSDLGKDLIAKGNGIEAFGNSLQAIGRTKLLTPKRELSTIYTIIGAWLQATGNTTNAVGIDIELSGSEEEGTLVDTLGSGIQGLGAAFEAVGASLLEESDFRNLTILGGSFIALGSFLGSIGNIYVLNDKNVIGEQILLVGSWFQVLGSFLLIHAVTIEFEPKPPLKNENGYYLRI